jgi:hypothetical protein
VDKLAYLGSGGVLAYLHISDHLCKEAMLANPQYACRRIPQRTIVALSLLAQPCKEGLAVEKSVVGLRHPWKR